VLRRVVARTGTGDPDLPGRLGNLGLVLRDRFDLRHDPRDVEEAVEVLQRAAEVAGPQLFVRSASNLSLALLDRYEHARDPADLAAAVDWALRAVTSDAAAAPEDRVAALANLAGALLARARRTGSAGDLDDAVVSAQAAATATPDGHPKRPLRLVTLGLARFRRYSDAGDLADLQQAIEALGTAAEAGSAAAVSALGGALRERYHRLGDPADLDAAVDRHRAAVAQTAGDDPARPGWLSNLAVALADLAERDGAAALLDEAMELHDRALTLAGEDHADVLSIVSNRTAGLYSRFQARGDVHDVTAASDGLRAALRQDGLVGPGRARYLGQLGLLLAARHRATGVEADLHEAVTALREAVAGLPPTHPDRALLCTVLGSALTTRYVRYGAITDLDEGISWHETAAALPGPVTSRPEALASTAYARRLRAERTGRATDVDAAIGASREAVAAAPGGDPPAGLLAALGSALAMRQDTVADLTEAVTVRRQVLARCPPDRPMRGPWTSDLGNSLRARAWSTGDGADLEEALHLHRSAVALTAPTHPEYATVLSNLAGSLRDRYVRDGNERDVDEALRLLRAVAELPTAPAERRLTAAETWARLAGDTGHQAEARDGYAAAVALLPAAVWRGGDSAARERPLRQARWLAADAAASALLLDDPELALDLLERGRAVLWNQRLETATDLDVLRERAPQLADRLEHARAVLDRPGVQDRPDLQGSPGPGSSDEARIVAAAEWEAAVAEVRQRPEFAELFGAAPQVAARLRDARLPGVAVVLTVSRLGCHAVLAGGGGVRSFPLAGLDLDELADTVEAYFTALAVLADPDENGGTARQDAEAGIGRVLRWLGAAVTDPVLDELGSTERVWWCPTGPLTYLPLHAAGSVPDRVVSSYTPTLGALLRPHTPDPAPTVVAVAAPEAPGQPCLTHALREVDDLAALLPPAVPLTRLGGPAATVEQVRAALQAHTWAHLACHGEQNLADPARGALVLPDGRLRVTDLAILGHYHAEGAYLSACQTALGGVELHDEALHLAAALQYAGFRQVIATLWPVGDTRARTTARHVYTALTAGGRFTPARAAYALSTVVRALRNRFPGHPSIWAPYVHIGP
jgi:hypothetical protein